jgi:hypothetical protein
MANNKMWLVNSVTGQRVMIASTSEGRAGTDSGVVAEWVTPGGIEDKLDRAFVEEFESSTSATGSTAWCIEYESGLRSLGSRSTSVAQSAGRDRGNGPGELAELKRGLDEARGALTRIAGHQPSLRHEDGGHVEAFEEIQRLAREAIERCAIVDARAAAVVEYALGDRVRLDGYWGGGCGTIVAMSPSRWFTVKLDDPVSYDSLDVRAPELTRISDGVVASNSQAVDDEVVNDACASKSVLRKEWLRKEWDAARHDRGDIFGDYESSDYVDGWNDALDVVDAVEADRGGSVGPVERGERGVAEEVSLGTSPAQDALSRAPGPVSARLARAERALDSARGELSSVNSVLDLAGVGSASFVGSRVEMLVKRRDALASASTDQAIQIAELRGELRQERERERASIAAHQQIPSAVAESAHVGPVFPSVVVKSMIEINSRLRRWPGLRRAKLGGSSGTAIAVAVDAADRGAWPSSVSAGCRDEIVGELVRLSEIDISIDHGAGFTESDRDEVTELSHVVTRLMRPGGRGRDRSRVTLPIPSDAELAGLVQIRTGDVTSASQATAADLWIDRVVRIVRGCPRDGDVDSEVAVQAQVRGVDGDAAAGADALASAGMSGDVAYAGSMTWRTLIAELGRLICGEHSSVALDRPVVLRVGFGDRDSADALARDRVGFLRSAFVDDGRGAPPALTMDADATWVVPELGRASSPRRDLGTPIVGTSVTSGPAGDRMRDGVVVDLSAIQLACARAMEHRPRDGSPPMVSISLDVLIAVVGHTRSIGEYVLELSRVAGGASRVEERIVELVKRGPVVAGDGGADACGSTVEIVPSSWLARRATSVMSSLDWLARAREVVVDLDAGMLKWPFDDPAEVADLGRRAADLLRSAIQSLS